MAVSITPTVTTPIPLIEYAQLLPEASPNRIFVENMVKNSDLLNVIKVLPAEYGKKQFADIGSLPSVGFRNLNSAGNQGTGSFNLREEDTFFIDEYIFTDRAIIDRLGEQHKYKQQELKNIALSQMASQILIKGDNSASGAKQPNGMQVRCNNYVSGNVTLGNLIPNSTASGGAVLSLANLDQLYWSVNKRTHFVVPRSLMPYFDIAARNTSLVNQTLTYTNDTDSLGRNIMKYKNIPILFGYEPDDSPDLLPFSEVAYGGGGAVTSSIYCANFNDGGFYMIEQTPLSLNDEGPVPGAPYNSVHIKWDWGIVREHPRAISRLSSIALGTIVA